MQFGVKPVGGFSTTQTWVDFALRRSHDVMRQRYLPLLTKVLLVPTELVTNLADTGIVAF
jgi:hypothetical protein